MDEKQIDNNDVKEELNVKRQENDVDALESVLYHVGEMGLYQKLLFIGMLPFGFFFAWIYFVQMFIAVTPQNYWCKVPELTNLSMELRQNLSVPVTMTGELERCMTFDANWTEVLQTLKPPSLETPLIPCQYGWEFDLTDIPYETIVTERGWVCGSASIVPTAQSLFFVGSLVGGVLLGWIADKYGRVPALMGANLIGGVAGVATIFTKGVWDFIICRFIVGMAYDNCFMMMYILVLEYVGAQHRTWVSTMSFALFFGAGCITLPWIALWAANWRVLLWVTSLPLFSLLLAPWLLPESARWLASQGRVKQAVKVLRRFEYVNGTHIPDDIMAEFIVSSNNSKEEEKGSFIAIFKSPPLRKAMILLVILHMGGAIIFDALIRLSESLGLNFFLAFTLTSSTEIPSLTILALVLNRWGRRTLGCVPLTLAGVLICIAIFVPKGIPQASLAIAARFVGNMSYTVSVQWVTEILPTAFRASGSSALHMCGYVATILCPFIVYSERIWSQLPLVIMVVISLISASASLALPETNGQPMPQSLADGEKIIREQSLCGKPENADDEPYNKKSSII